MLTASYVCRQFGNFVITLIHNKFTFIVPHTLQKYMLDVYCDILANLD
jgi:hypothetical protein